MQISAFGVYRQGRVNFSAHLQLGQDITLSFRICNIYYDIISLLLGAIVLIGMKYEL